MLVRGAPGWSLRLSPFNDVVKAYGLSLYSRSEMVDLLSERLARVRFAMRLLWIAALVGVLSTLGSILGVLRYVVSTDRKNIAIRLALGAGLRQIFAAYVARTLAPVGVGAVAGVVLSGVSYAFVRQLVNVAPARAAWVVISLAVGVVVSALMLLLGVLAPVRRRPIHAVLGN
jgi:predicted lysophospholipase L1 biosynthesis ABC-type transport system permease subunit